MYEISTEASSVTIEIVRVIVILIAIVFVLHVVDVCSVCDCVRVEARSDLGGLLAASVVSMTQ